MIAFIIYIFFMGLSAYLDGDETGLIFMLPVIIFVIGSVIYSMPE